MTWEGIGWHNGLIVHLAALITIAGLLMRDQLKLRALVLVGNGLYAIYFLVAPPLPLWDAMFWSTAMGTANFVMIVIIWRSRQHFDIDEHALQVFAALESMEPGEFRRLMALGRVRQTLVPLELTRLGEMPERLYFVTAGTIVVDRPDRSVRLERPTFIGEVAFMLGTPATASVTLSPGGRYVRWDSDALRALLKHEPRIQQCFERAFSRDLATKLREVQPEAAT